VIPQLAEDQLHFLPPEVYGFNLIQKRWVSFLVDDVEPVVFDEKAWDHLVLDPDVKVEYLHLIAYEDLDSHFG
jgi:hypothetical protein